MTMVHPSDVQDLLGRWWFEYDQGNFAAWGDCFTADAHFSCRSDSGHTAFEEFIRADVDGRDQVVEWQANHRRDSPYPLRHHATDVHLTSVGDDVADFRSYLLATQIVGGAVSNLATGLVVGTARVEQGTLRLADLRVILDFTDSEVFSARERQPAP